MRRPGDVAHVAAGRITGSMALLHRPHIVVALLAAIFLVSAAAPDASAWLPSARRYHPGRPITLDTDLVSRSGVSAWAIDEYLRARTPLPKLGGAFLDAERKYGVNARFLLAAAMHESGWGTSSISRVKHNLFGYNAYDRDPGRYASAFSSYARGIDAVARFMKEAYLTPGGRWWGGQPTLRSMQLYWSSSGGWGRSVSRIASSMKLGSLRGRGIRSMTSAVQGLVHDGGRATVTLAWRQGALPAAIGFRATWTALELDTPLAARAESEQADEVQLPEPLTVAAREGRARSGSVTLQLAAPKAPGTYRLQVTPLDAGGRSLPAADRPAIPATTVHVWADRAVHYDIKSSSDGSGVTLRVTNTGTQPIPALPSWGSSAPADPEVASVRSMVTLTASSNDPAKPAPVMLVQAPLVKDLAPGAWLVFHVHKIDELTGRGANWLSVDLRVAEDPAWLAAYSPVGTRRSGSRLGTLAREEPLTMVATAGEGRQWEAPPPTPTPTPAPEAPSPTPAPTPAATPAPELVATPTPTPVATPVPTAEPAPEATQAPKVKHVTRVRSEDSSAIRYRGRWGDASGGGYMGGGVKWSTTPGASATFTFTGTSVRWIGPVGPTRGRALVRIDGKAVATVNMWRSSFDARRVLFAKSFKKTGRHTLTITVLSSPGHPYVAIDGFVIRT